MPSAPESSRRIPLGDGVWLLDVGTRDTRRHCVIFQTPAGLVLIEPPADSVDALIEAFSQGEWRFSDLIAILATGATMDGIVGAFQVGLRNRRCRLLLPGRLLSRMTCRSLSKLLGEDMDLDRLEAAVARAESVRALENIGPGGRSIDVLSGPYGQALIYHDLQSGIAFSGTTLEIGAESVPPQAELKAIRGCIEDLRGRGVLVVVSPNHETISPADLIASMDSYVASRIGPPTV